MTMSYSVPFSHALCHVAFAIVYSFSLLMLRTSCLTLEINEFRCYEVKIEDSSDSSASSTYAIGQQCLN